MIIFNFGAFFLEFFTGQLAGSELRIADLMKGGALRRLANVR